MRLTADRLRELFNYDPETGVFTRRIGVKGSGAGVVAGSAGSSNGRRTLGVDGKNYLSYRLAWLHVTGAWPSLDIDHINGVHDDDRFANLRLASKSQNLANAKRPKTNTSGFKGVVWHAGARKWRAQIKHNQNQIHIGFFADPKVAHAAYVAKATELFGEFARAA